VLVTRFVNLLILTLKMEYNQCERLAVLGICVLHFSC
jgi:hypothetical protein